MAFSVFSGFHGWGISNMVFQELRVVDFYSEALKLIDMNGFNIESKLIVGELSCHILRI